MHDANNEHGGIYPDIEVKVPLETEKKLIQQGDEIYFPGKDGKDEKSEKSEAKKKEMTPDEVLNRAVELLKAREVLGNLKPGK
jgi:hypothetical protein